MSAMARLRTSLGRASGLAGYPYGVDFPSCFATNLPIRDHLHHLLPTCWLRTISQHESNNATDESNGQVVDTSYRSATDLVWPATRRQEKYAARVHRALSAVLERDARLRQDLVEQIGFTVKDVRVSPDHAKAFILWNAYNSSRVDAEAALRQATSRLKSGIAKAMATKSMPRLEFRYDQLSSQQEQMERLFERLEEERNREEER